MPVPKQGETEEEFIPRCISELVNEGYDADQAAAICYSKYEEFGWDKGNQRDFKFDPNSTENEGRFRLYPPDLLEKYKRIPSPYKGIDYIIGIEKNSNKSHIQALRFDLNIWTESRAKQWWNDNKDDYTFYFSIIKVQQYSKNKPFKMKNTKIIELFLNDDECIDAIALVKYPAIEVDWKAFNSSKLNITLAKTDIENKIISGPAMIPNKQIYRYDPKTNDEYYVYFSPSTIKKVAEAYLIHKKNDSVNLEHETPIDDVSIVESWIVIDPENDKAKAMGFTVPIGTWMCSMKVNNEDIWNDIKENKFAGFSIEGYFSETFDKHIQDEDQKLLEEIKKLLNSYK